MTVPSNPYSRATFPDYAAYSESLRNPPPLSEEDAMRLECEYDLWLEQQEREHSESLNQIEEENAYLYDHPELAS